MKGPQTKLVVDADIARAAGPDPKQRPWSATAKNAHDVLAAIRETMSYHLVFDSTLKAEWKKHSGDTARRWFAQMLSQRRVKIIASISDWIDELVDQLASQDRAVANKDKHLVVLAHDHGDQRIFSNDNKAKEKFGRIPDARLDSIHWVQVSGEAVRWIKDGTPMQSSWTLAACRKKL